MAFEITDANFKTEVLDRKGVTMIDFWAEWCGPCRMIAPFVNNLSEEYKDRALVGKVDVDHNQEISVNYKIHSIPTILFFKDGVEVKRHVGLATQAKLAEMLEAQLDPVVAA